MSQIAGPTELYRLINTCQNCQFSQSIQFQFNCEIWESIQSNFEPELIRPLVQAAHTPSLPLPFPLPWPLFDRSERRSSRGRGVSAWKHVIATACAPNGQCRGG